MIAMPLYTDEKLRYMKANNDSHDPWHHFDEAFRHFDRGWAEADKGFNAFSETAKNPHAKDHTITANTWGKRWKMFCVFQRIAWRLLFRGKVIVRL